MMTSSTTDMDDTEPTISAQSTPLFQPTIVAHSVPPYQTTTVANIAETVPKFNHKKLYPILCAFAAWMLFGAIACLAARNDYPRIFGNWRDYLNSGVFSNKTIEWFKFGNVTDIDLNSVHWPEDFHYTIGWLRFQCSLQSKSFLLTSTFGTVVTSIIVLVFLRCCSKIFVYAFIIFSCLTVPGMIVLNAFAVRQWFEGDLWMGVLSLAIPPFVIFLIMMLRSFERRDVDVLGTFVEDSAQAIFFIPQISIVTLLATVFLYLEYLFFAMVTQIIHSEVSYAVITYFLVLINSLGFLWTFCFTLDISYLITTSAFTAWKFGKDKSTLKRTSVISDIPCGVRNGAANLVYGSSLISILEQWSVAWNKWSLKYSTAYSGLYFIYTRFFNSGAYTMYLITKKDHSNSSKVFAEVLSKNPVKYAIYVFMNVFLVLVWTGLLYGMLLLSYLAFCQIVKSNLSWDQLLVFSTILPVFGISWTWQAAFYTMMIHHISAESHVVELLNIYS